MIKDLQKRDVRRKRRVMRVRKRVRGNHLKPRLCVFKSNKHLSAQLIDDENGVTLASAGTMTKEFRKGKEGKKSIESARSIGTQIAELAKGKNIQNVIFDRGHRKYHGLLAELANAARDSGLQF